MKWLPQSQPDDPDALGLAYYLEERQWKRNSASVQNAIANAFKKR